MAVLKSCAVTLLLAVALACGKGGTSPVAPSGPEETPPEVVDVGDIRPIKVPSRSQVENYRGCLTGARDSWGRVIWSPALPGATPEVRHDWYRSLRSCGATHIPIGPFHGGPVYPGAPWPNPRWVDDPAAIRGLVVEMMNEGFVPVIFMEGNDVRPSQDFLPTLRSVSTALDGIGTGTITVLVWEPLWEKQELINALQTWLPLSQGSLIAYHGAQGREMHPGFGLQEFWKLPWAMFLHQSLLIENRAQLNCTFGQLGCWKNNTQRAIAFHGAGLCITDAAGGGDTCWVPRQIVVAFESTAYHEFREGDVLGKLYALIVRDLCATYSARCGYGQNVP